MFCCLDWACYKGLTWPLITLFLSLCLHFFIVILLYDFDKIIVEHFLFFEDIYFMIFGRKTCRNASVAVLVIMFGVFDFFEGLVYYNGVLSLYNIDRSVSQCKHRTKKKGKNNNNRH